MQLTRISKTHTRPSAKVLQRTPVTVEANRHVQRRVENGGKLTTRPRNMPKQEVEFIHCGRPPYIRELHSYTCDGSGGIIEFDGYYRLNDGEDDFYEHCKSLPSKELICTRLLSDTPRIVPRLYPSPLVDICASEPSEVQTCLSYSILEQNTYLIEVYRRETIECTNQISRIEDEDGEEMNVCFFPTDRQRLYFRVLETNMPNERFVELRDSIEKTETDRQNAYYASKRAVYPGVSIDRQTQSN